jgi:hypothetical protein
LCHQCPHVEQLEAEQPLHPDVEAEALTVSPPVPLLKNPHTDICLSIFFP